MTKKKKKKTDLKISIWFKKFQPGLKNLNWFKKFKLVQKNKPKKKIKPQHIHVIYMFVAL